MRWAVVARPRQGGRDLPTEFNPTVIVLTDFEVANKVLYLEERFDMMQETGILSVEQADRWLETVHRAGRDELLFCAITGFTVAGTVPTGLVETLRR